ncbi:Ldh family oxidoreductase [Gaiella sp.]|uniref:Ldh family oxidoreductase n=1 Tax=Gaiella sp. TaxID=2663207 RepID=UPI0032641A22
MSDAPSTPTEARARLASLGISSAAADVLFAHFDDAERRGKRGHGYSRIAWLEEQPFDREARPELTASSREVDRWDGGQSLGYLTLQTICDELVTSPPASIKLVIATRCFPTGALGYWVRQLAERAGLIALLTATSPPRLAHPDGSEALTGTNPLAIAIPSSEGPPIVVDVSMGAVTHGEVLAGLASPEELVPFGGASAHKAFALAVGLELLVGALAGPEHGAVMLVARPDFDPVPGFRARADGLRLPGDS